MQITVSEGPVCPLCGGNEVLLGGPVRPFKVGHAQPIGCASNCTACDIWFGEDNSIEVRPDQYVEWLDIEEIADFKIEGRAPKLEALILKCREKLTACTE